MCRFRKARICRPAPEKLVPLSLSDGNRPHLHRDITMYSPPKTQGWDMWALTQELDMTLCEQQTCQELFISGQVQTLAR